MYWALLDSGIAGGTSLNEMRYQWTLKTLYDAYDMLYHKRAREYAQHKKNEK